MTKIQFYYLSWNKLHEDCFQLLKKIKAKKLKFDRIVCISRGGLVVSRIFSDFLALPISNFTVVSYIKPGQIKKPRIVEQLRVNIKGENILLVDEVVDRGVTLKIAFNYLKGFFPKKITTLVPYIKVWSKPKPDFWQVKTDKWLIYPYEVKETIRDVVKIWQKETGQLSNLAIKNRSTI